MKSIYSVTLLALIFVLSAFTTANDYKELEIGAKAPMTEVKMNDISGESVSLSDVAGKNGLLVVFSCNTCPYVLAWEDRYLEISKLAKELNIGMIAVNSNEANRENVDSMEEMQKHAKEKNYDFYYTIDEDSKMADAYGATRTPHIYLFNPDMTLVYRGAIDDNSRSAEKVDEHWLSDAMKALVEGKDISKKTSKAIGCTIKRVSNI